MSGEYNKSENEYGRIMSIGLYAMIFFAFILAVQLAGQYRLQKVNTKTHCLYISKLIKQDVSYGNQNALVKFFDTGSEYINNPVIMDLGLVHWNIKSENTIVAEEVKHKHTPLNNIFEIEQSCPVENIRSLQTNNTDYSLTVTSKFMPNQTQFFWMFISSLFLAGLPLLIYSRISNDRLVEKNQLIDFFSQIANREQRNLSDETIKAKKIGLILRNETQSIINFIDETREINDQIDPEYINRLEQNFIDLEERNAYLAIQNKDLTRQTTLKSSFFANLSHDFRTPLYTIDGYSRLLLNANLESQNLSHVNRIKIANANLLELVANFLSLSRLEAGKIDLEFSKLDLRKLLDEIVTGLSFLTTEHHNHFFIDVSEQLPGLIEVDALKLRQILANLISNAVKYTQAGIIYIRVSCRQLGEDTLSVSLSINDTGQGISKHEIDTIFDPYTRLDIEKTNIHGSGLGLGICKELCEIIGAKLSVSSEIDKGSNFTIDLTTKISEQSEDTPDYHFKPLGHDMHVFNNIPAFDLYLQEWLRPLDINLITQQWNILTSSQELEIVKPDDKLLIILDYNQLESIENWAPKLKHFGDNVIICAPMDVLTSSQLYFLEPFVLVNNSLSNYDLSESITLKESSQTNIVEQLKEEPLKDYILLLAEDNDFNREIIEERLISFGAQVISCPDGSAALELYKARKYSAILLDAHMPKISGTQLTEIIRGDFDDKTTPIIGITASTSTIEYQHFIQSGMTDCLIKPLDDQLLIETIQKFATPQIDEKTAKHPVLKTIQSVKQGSVQSIQERIDFMSIDSIKNHITELNKILKTPEILEKQDALFNEVHKLNGTLSMTSYKKLQSRVNEVETLINPVLWSPEEHADARFVRQLIKAEEEILKLFPDLEKIIDGTYSL